MPALKMRQRAKPIGVPSMLHKLISNEPAGREEEVDALLIRHDPAMRIGFSSQRDASGRPRITVRSHRVPERSALAAFTGVPLRNHVVAGAKQLEIVQVVQHGNAFRPQFPQNRGSQVVVDVAHVRDVGTELTDHSSDFCSRV